jgi:long-chain acyl-CoA synthetase
MTEIVPREHPVTRLLALAREQPDKRWLIQPSDGEAREWTWTQAVDEVGRMAAALRAMGLDPGARLAISGNNTAHWLLADYAITLAGYVPVGLYPKQAAAHVSYIMNHCKASAVFVGPMPDSEEFMGALPDGLKTIGLPYSGVPECDTTWDELLAGAGE